MARYAVEQGRMVCKWNKSGAGLFQASVVGYDGGQYHLIVERVPGQCKERAWDWAMWRAAWSETIGQDGYSGSAKSAMEAAERAAAAELISRAISGVARKIPPPRRFVSQRNHFLARPRDP